jgi:glutamate-ammonia-ligase adenylyltransferase
VDAAAAARALGRLAPRAQRGGWGGMLDQAWPALAPVFAASPYLASLASREPDRLRRVLLEAPETRLDALIAAAWAAQDFDASGDPGEEAMRRLRRIKGEAHLLIALADLGGVWDLEAVTGGLSRLADAAVRSALEAAAREQTLQGRMTARASGPAAAPEAEGPVPGFFVIAMGKLGALELNYSSDIDLSVFYEPAALPLASGVAPEVLVRRLTDRLGEILQRRTSDGYVFRVDLRLRPDPASTPAAVSVPAALHYYQTVGQNWERAAFIKARPLAGDLPRARAFLAELSSFVWRRNLDFAAIADIHAIKRQIHIWKTDDRLTAPGADLKLGRGGIREVEFYVQTQQLILGGRQSALRVPSTLAALDALAAAGRITAAAAGDMAGAYRTLRGLEHRVQMLADDQTHRLPEADADRRRVAALAGFATLRAFDASVGRVLRRVNRRYGELFAGEEPLSSRFGSLIFTGVEDDAETLATLRRMGFSQGPAVSATIRGWHHGHIAATRTERGREALTRLAPRLLEAAAATGAPDAAFARFADFFSGLKLGVQVQSMFLAQPRLLERVVRVMAFAPRFARTLARRPAVLDALLDGTFFGPIEAQGDLAEALRQAPSFEAAMDEARRLAAESAFRIAVQVLSADADAQAAGEAFTRLADQVIQGLSAAALAEIGRLAGDFPGDVAVIALGKCGSREMSARSDLDLMTLYRPHVRPDASQGAESAIKGWSAQTFYARFTQRLVAALSAPTAAGELYEVDLQLRPSGTAGPVAVSFPAFEAYYAGEAETWELLALCRARVVWASSSAFAGEAAQAIERALRRPRDIAACAKDVRDMRALMAAERPPGGFWDLKLGEGGMVDMEFTAQYLQLAGAAAGGPLRQNTDEALGALEAAYPALTRRLEGVRGAWRLQGDLSQLLKIALDDDASPDDEPPAFKSLLAKAGGAANFAALRRRLIMARRAARAAFDALIPASLAPAEAEALLQSDVVLGE